MSTKSKKLKALSLFWDYMSALSLILVLIMLWYLGKGPVRVNFLRPYIIQALTNETATYDLNVKAVNLELVNSVQPIKIIANEVEFKNKQGNYLIQAPHLSLSFSARALLKGLLAPSSITIDSPTIQIKKTYKNNSTQKNTTTKNNNLDNLEFYFTQFEDFMERFNSPEHLYLESFINSIDINDASLTMYETDNTKQFTLEDMEFNFSRGLTKINIESNSMAKFDDRISAIDSKLIYHIKDEQIEYNLSFTDLVINDLYEILSPSKKDIQTVDIPVNGEFTALIDFGNILKHKENFANNISNNIKEISFQIEGGQGKIGFGDSQEYDYDVSSFNLGGSLHGGLNTLNINDATFDFDNKETTLSLQATGFKDYLFNNNLEDFKLNFDASLGDFNIDELSSLWPKYIGEKAWEWSNDALSGGTISNGKFSFNFGYNPQTKTFGLINLEGTADVLDADLDYLEGMPVIKNVYGTVNFSQDEISIKVDKGVSDGVILTNGKVVLYDLDKEDNFIKIDLVGNSSITNALLLINNEPLGFTKEMGINPTDVAGNVDINLKLDFELTTNLSPEDIKVDIQGHLKDVEYLALSNNRTFTSDELILNVTDAGYTLEGVAKFDTIPVKISVDEKFHGKNTNRKIIADIKLNDTALKKLGVQSEILAYPYFTGSSDIKATITFLKNDEVNIYIDGSLKDTMIDYAFLGFSKDIDTPCRAKANLIIKNEKITKVDKFSIIKSQFEANGEINMDYKGRIKEIEINEIKSPKTFAKAKIEFNYDPKLKLKVTVSGDSYDLTEFFDKRKTGSTKNDSNNNDNKDTFEDFMDTDIVISVNKLWTNKYIPITNFAGLTNIRNKIGVDRMQMVGNYGTSKEVTMKLNFEPRGEEHILSINSNNAGSTLKVLRLYDNMSGGNLKIDAKRDKYKNFKGHIKMYDFSLINPPVFARVLSVASLTGILDILRGDGLVFSHFNAPFEYTYSNKNLTTTEAKMIGSVVGLRLSGSYNMRTEAINAFGMLIPAYTINSMLGSIPLIGKVLAGSDGTIFATNFSIKGNADKPDVTINPLSTLAPNSIKELFSSWTE